LIDITQLQDTVDLQSYDHIIVAFSGGKDSLACILTLLECGVPKSKIELWHHLIDGKNGHFMDWSITKSYVEAIAKALELRLYFSWREEGFEGEMLRFNARSHNIAFETPTGIDHYQVHKGNFSTRMKFPMIHATDLNRRWCSSILKIDVGRIAISHQERFLNKRLLFVSGERAEESKARAGYNVFEIHKMDNRTGKRRVRIVDAWRPVHKFTLMEIWALIKRWNINPHPCYRLGWGRCSCAICIFSSPNQIATLRIVQPIQFSKVLAYEKQFAKAIHYKKHHHENVNVFLDEYAENGVAYSNLDKVLIELINSEHFTEPIFVKKWKFPKGCQAEQTGPY
jgi:3'-phosphoadenosine 5'-phosphosulfate sulfotransferase (PAPS reductase)/FAD synthetase